MHTFGAVKQWYALLQFIYFFHTKPTSVVMVAAIRPRRLIVVFMVFFFTILAGVVIAGMVMDEKLPDGKEGPEAEALAQKMLNAINHEAWLATGAVTWSFRGGHDFIWDRTRHYVKVSWKKYEVYVDINARQGVAFKKGTQLQGQEANELVNTAWEFWVNDSFWLNPISKIKDPGTTRKLVTRKNGSEALLVTYSSGGVTPGDSYLWLLDENSLPTHWRLWVQIVPVGGGKFTWKGWITTETGVKISTEHSWGPLNIPIENVETASTLTGLSQVDSDIFTVLTNR